MIFSPKDHWRKTSHEKPFDQTEIKSLKLKNRFIRSATWEGLADKAGRVRPELTDLYLRLAKGKVALIITGFSYIRGDGQAQAFQTGIHADELLPDLRKLTRAVHEADGRIAMQIMHGAFDADRI